MLSAGRLRSDDSVQGRFFLGFATLVLSAELERRMRAASLHKTMTDANVLDKLGKAKALVTRKGNRILLEVSKKQRELLAALKVPGLA
jgi:transposase